MIIEFKDRAEHWNDDNYIVAVEQSGVVSVTKIGQFANKRVRVYKDWIAVLTENSPNPSKVTSPTPGWA